MTLSREQFKGLHRDLMSSPGKEGGFSIHAVTGESPTEGHMVSLPDTEEMTLPASATKPSQLPRYVRRNREELSRPDIFFGGWKPETDEYTTLDRSQQVKARPEVVAEHGAEVADVDALTSALDLGVARDQFSVYSVKRGRSIDTKINRQV